MNFRLLALVGALSQLAALTTIVAADDIDTSGDDPTPTVNEPDPDDTGTKFKHFTAYSSSQTCDADQHAQPFNNQIRGVNLGGWMVLEPWLTPSLFYQFLGKGVGEVGMDHYSFCDVLGPEEGNRQLRRHWETWVTKDLIEELADSGAVNSLRIPVGDFMFQPYGPYSELVFAVVVIVGCVVAVVVRVTVVVGGGRMHNRIRSNMPRLLIMRECGVVI